MKAFFASAQRSTLQLVTGVSIGTSDGDTNGATRTTSSTRRRSPNANDRSISADGEQLLTGAMVPSPSGRRYRDARNTVTLIYDVTAATYHEFATPLSTRAAFAKNSDALPMEVAT